ncbi:MAG: hypothetical protein WD688_00635 [Candidatus Binatia bacterium]
MNLYSDVNSLSQNSHGQVGIDGKRFDVDTGWLRENGVIAAKDELTVKEFFTLENQSEEKLQMVREPALKVAKALLR